MYKVKNAIIMAAGKGERMHPVTLITPKPLVKVNGIRMIDTVIRSLHENGITEIYIVVGYLKEQFQELKSDYPDINIIDNPYYMSCNNISSLYVAREHLGDTMILDGDQIICHSEVLNPIFERSGYNAVWNNGYTDEWLLNVENGIIKSCSRNGGEKGWQLFSISRWNQKDCKKLRKHLELEFEEKKNRNIYWDDIAMFCHPDEYELGIVEMQKDDVIELDSLRELAQIDNWYHDYLESAK